MSSLNRTLTHVQRRWHSATILLGISHLALTESLWTRLLPHDPDFSSNPPGKNALPDSCAVRAGFITFLTRFCILLLPSVRLQTHFQDYDLPIREPAWVMLSFPLIDMPHLSAWNYVPQNCISAWDSEIVQWIRIEIYSLQYRYSTNTEYYWYRANWPLICSLRVLFGNIIKKPAVL